MQRFYLFLLFFFFCRFQSDIFREIDFFIDVRLSFDITDLMNNIPPYELSKTLRFSLIPRFETEKHIEEHTQAGEFLMKDEKRDRDYADAKKILDRYHRKYIEDILKNFRLSIDSLKNAATYKAQSDKEKLKEEYESLRKEIVKKFTEGDACKEKKRGKIEFESVKDTLNKLLSQNNDQQKDFNEQDKKLLTQFKGLTTPYFSQYATARNNVYTADDQTTAFAYRTINDNLDKFLCNQQNWEKIREKLSDKLHVLQQQLSVDLKKHLSCENVDQVFELQTFNQCILQGGITLYNTVLGGKKPENCENIKGINQLINEYNQCVDKKDRLHRLIPLYKQIMGDAVSLSFVKPCFDSADELWNAVNDYYLKELLGDAEEESYLSQIAHLIEDLDADSAQGVYINTRKIASVSQHVFGDYSYIERLFEAEWKNQKKNRTKEVTMPDVCELSEILRIVGEEKQQKTLDALKSVRIPYREKAQDEELDKYSPKEAVVEIKNRFDKIKGLCNNTNNGRSVIDLRRKSSEKDYLKAFLDALLEFCHTVFFFRASSKDKDKIKRSEEFYKEYDALEKKLRVMPSLYDKVRNYVTRKPYSTKKYRVFFDAKQRCEGWASSKEKDYKSFILRKFNETKKDFDYYLGIYNTKKQKDYFCDEAGNLRYPSPDNNTPCYEKMMYAQIADAVKDLPHLFFSNKWKTNHVIPAHILEIKENESYKKSKDNKENKSLKNEALHQLIDYYKKCIPQYAPWRHFNFISLKETSAYQSIKEFANDVDQDGYRMWFERIAETKIRDMVKDGKLLLFQIYNKDFSERSTGRENLHTMYWKALFSPENLENPLYKLNGKAELFFRKATPDLKKEPTHKKGDKKTPKTPKTPKSDNSEPGRFPHDIVKDKRFTKDSYQFHVPITLNFRKGTQKAFNESCIEYIKQLPEDDIHFIGIDRGERHLIYLSLIDRNGNIVEQKSYNTIVSKTTKADGKSSTSEYDYHEALDKKENERQKARVNWDAITAIKDLKSGFLSQVVSDIARMMVKYHAVVALEDLNIGFKRGRFKIEKQVYQKFEKALIDKLNYLVFKDKDPDEEGGIRKPLQLTAPFESFQKLGKQTGMLFYVPAAYTSKIDPTTGFVDQLKPCYINEKQAQEFFQNFESITYKKDYFVFTADYEKFGISEQKQTWKICTHGGACRFIFCPKKKKFRSVDVTKVLKNKLKKRGIEYKQGQDLRPVLAKGDKDLLEAFIKGLKFVLRLRYADSQGNDVLISPVENAQGIFFNSSQIKEEDKLPINPDANGAYHIALKMLMLYEQKIKKHDSQKKLIIKNKDWFDFACQRFNKQ